jgi:exodeoxyribonuclease-3
MRKGSLRKFIDEYAPDILLLQETKIAAAQMAESDVAEEFSDYVQFYSFAKKPGYAGTAVWVKKSLAGGVFRVADIDSDGLEDKYGDLLKEGRLTGVELPKCICVCAYVPNAKEDLSRLPVRQRWDEYLAEVLLGLQKNKPVIVAGDFNVAHASIDLARPAANVGKHGYTDEERRGFSELLRRAKLLDSFRVLHPNAVKYSWWSHWGKARANNVGWRIDYVLLSQALRSKLKDAEIYAEVLGSDHCPVGICVEI